MEYQRDKAGKPFDFRGMNIMSPPDRMPPGKFPFAQNVRRVVDRGAAARPAQGVALHTLPSAPHTIRRLNDSTPNGPGLGYVVVIGADGEIFLDAVQVDSGYSGNPVSMLSFRPNASVQPWMYIADLIKMSKVRSDGKAFKTGIMEPQVAPSTTFVPASDTVSLLGDVTVYIFNNPIQAHNAPLESVYLWHNPADGGASGLIETEATANSVNVGNSLLFDLQSINGTLPVAGTNPVAWSQYTTFQGTVNVNGTAVTWDSGDQFSGLVSGNQLVIGGVTYTLASTPTNTTATLTASGGVQTAVAYTAAVLGPSISLFAPAMESEGYQDFNCSILGTFYVPAAGTYSFVVKAKDDFIWGIGNAPNGQVSWPGLSGGQSYSSYGQTMTTISGYPLIPRTHESSGGDNQFSSVTINITFSAPGNYPFEIDWDYWYHNQRGLMVQVNGNNIPPIPPSAITDTQYRFTYYSSETGAESNPSPASPQAPLSVLSNNVTATVSTDPQVDQINFYRLDEGLENYTFVGRVPNAQAFTYFLGQAVTSTGIQTVELVEIGRAPGTTEALSSNIPIVGQQLVVDSGTQGERITVTGVSFFNPPSSNVTEVSITANFTKTHAALTTLSTTVPVLSDSLLDVDIAGNPILNFDNYEPFPSIDLPRSGLVSVAAGVVNWQAGDFFNPRWLPGTVIIIGTVAYTLNTRPTTNTVLTASNVDIVNGVETVVLPPDATNVPYQISEPILAAQPLPYVWGPTDNVAFFMGVGDPLRPGTIYWTKGNDMDAAPDTNQQDITSPSDVLINGIWVDGFGIVFSADHKWVIWPNYFNALATATGTEGSTWTFQGPSGTRGLFMPRALATDGKNVFFRGKDGVYVTGAGGVEVSITDGDLYPLFSHEGSIPQPVTIAGLTIYPPDDTQPSRQKMSCATGYLYYDYVDTTGTPRTLVFDILAGGWVWDVYQYPVTVHALEEGPGVNGVLVGCADGTVRNLGQGGLEDQTAFILTPADDAGDSRAEKHWGDVYIEVE